jgi:hypothetical protein
MPDAVNRDSGPGQVPARQTSGFGADFVDHGRPQYRVMQVECSGFIYRGQDGAADSSCSK